MSDEFRIAKLALEDGDILVVKMRFESQEDVDRTHNMLRHLVPSGVKILSIQDGIELSILRKEEAAAILEKAA